MPESEAHRSGPKSLHAISIQASISAGLEGGFFQPAAGGDQEWITAHWEEMKSRAGQGDQFASDVVSNIESDSNFIQTGK